MKKLYILILTFCLVFYITNAQEFESINQTGTSNNDDVYITGRSSGGRTISKYTEELPNISIRCIAANEKELWVGTLAGLLRFSFDTYLWKKYTEDDGLLDDKIIKVFSCNNLTVATTQNGLSLLSHSKDSLYSWKFNDLELDVLPEIKVSLFDDIAVIGQNGSFLLYPGYPRNNGKYNWKKFHVPPKFKGTHVCSFQRDSVVLWVGGDKFFGTFLMDDEKWHTVVPVSGKVLSVLLEPDIIWLRLPDSVCWATRKGVNIDESLNYIPISNTKGSVCIDGQVYILTSKSLFRLKRSETEKERQTVTITGSR